MSKESGELHPLIPSNKGNRILLSLHQNFGKEKIKIRPLEWHNKSLIINKVRK